MVLSVGSAKGMLLLMCVEDREEEEAAVEEGLQQRLG
jgi:hypothetical protein